MPLRLVALDGGSDISIDRDLMVVGRHLSCDARLESVRVSRRHCCMTSKNGDLEVRDLGSTNGIRINGHRVDLGTVRPGDELAIAHLRYRLQDGHADDQTVMASFVEAVKFSAPDMASDQGPLVQNSGIPDLAKPNDNLLRVSLAGQEQDPLSATVRSVLPAEYADRKIEKIQVIVQLPGGVHVASASPEISPDSGVSR